MAAKARRPPSAGAGRGTSVLPCNSALHIARPHGSRPARHGLSYLLHLNCGVKPLCAAGQGRFVCAASGFTCRLPTCCKWAIYPAGCARFRQEAARRKRASYSTKPQSPLLPDRYRCIGKPSVQRKRFLVRPRLDGPPGFWEWPNVKHPSSRARCRKKASPLKGNFRA